MREHEKQEGVMENIRYMTAQELRDFLGVKRLSQKAAKAKGVEYGSKFLNNGTYFYVVADIEK